MSKDTKSDGLTISLEKKSIALRSEDGVLVLKLANEYGNSVKYEISDSYRFDKLLANLWEFVKDSQH